MKDPLPIDDILPAIVEATCTQPNVVVQAPPGAGKTSRVPPALLDAALVRGLILVLEPRRLAARAAARRMAEERGQIVGDEIGFQVRFERCRSPRTRILVVTPGILLRFLHDDPFLEQVGCIIFDEFHERGLDSDLALGLCRLLQLTVRPELRLVIMSATLAAEKVGAWLGDCPILVSEGQMHPVSIEYQPRSERQPWPVATAAAVEALLPRTPGDLLVFLPGLQEIRQTARLLETASDRDKFTVLPLHGDLPAEQQDAVLRRGTGRRVILATNVAETSVTVEGITTVVDTGLARWLECDPRSGLDRLRLGPISQASAEQRAGRAGRLQPGVCVRLWTPANHRQRPAETPPEILRIDLAGAVLQLLCLGEKNLLGFPWLDPPAAERIDQAILLLQRLGAVQQGQATETGRALARLPVHPRLARLLLEGQRLGHPRTAALAAALLSERDPFRTPPSFATVQQHVSFSDVLDRIDLLESVSKRSGTEAISQAALRQIHRAADQLLHLLPRHPESREELPREEALPRALLAAFPDRLARRREPGSRRGLMVGGRGVRLLPSSNVTDAELFLCIDLDAGPSEALVRLASGVQRDWLPSEALSVTTEVFFDDARERVAASRRIRYEDLLLEESPATLADDAAAARLLSERAGARLDRVLPEEDSAAASFLRRARCLHVWRPDWEIPSWDESMLRELVSWLCAGRRSFAELRQADWLGMIRARLTAQQFQLVEREAPERLEVPSGSQIRLVYEPGRPPILAARIQELFGLRQTPRIAGGQIPVLLHLLAPNYRPQQVTDDLESFWNNTYPVIRKELRARYPRHAWPEDPWTATAERRPRRK